MTEAKLGKFGDEFLKIINPSGNLKEEKLKHKIRDILKEHPLPNLSLSGLSSERSCSMFTEQGLTASEISQKRGIGRETVMGHLIVGLKQGFPIRMIELGVTDELRDVILEILTEMKIDGKRV